MNLERMPTSVVSYPLWLRGWCALTALATFSLIAIGTLVTTFGVGMADTVWPTPPWYLLFHERAGDFGWYVEHSHRIAGYLVGMFILVQTVAVWWWTPNRVRWWLAGASLLAVTIGTGYGMFLVRSAPAKSLDVLANLGFYLAIAGATAFAIVSLMELFSGAAGRWHRALMTFAFVGVVTQGMLGGLRVYLNELRGPELAVVHGIFAQFVFACICSVALMVGRRWNTLTDLITESTLRNLTAALWGLLVVQIVFGGLLRHLGDPWGNRLHPLLGVAVVGLAVWILARTQRDVEGASFLRGKSAALLTTIAVQIVLGIESWLRIGRAEGVSITDAAVRSMHVLVGFGVFATAAMLAARAWKAKLI